MTSDSGESNGTPNSSLTSFDSSSHFILATPSKAPASTASEPIPKPTQIQSSFTPFHTAPSTPMIGNAEAGPSTPPSDRPSDLPSAFPATPAAQMSQSQPIEPTPAREILRLTPKELKTAADNMLPRPLTPPKATERSARNGYPAWATPKTTVKKPPSAFFTRQAMTTARPGIRAPEPVQPIPFDLQPQVHLLPRLDRQVAALPNRARPHPLATPARLPNPPATPATRKITVPVPFGGSVSRSTQAAANRVLATPSKSAQPAPLLFPAKASGPALSKPPPPMIHIEETDEMDVDSTSDLPTSDAAAADKADGIATGELAKATSAPVAAAAEVPPAAQVLSEDKVSVIAAAPPRTPAPTAAAPLPTTAATTRTLRKRAPTIATSLPTRRPHSRPASVAGTVIGPLPLKPTTAEAPDKVPSGPRYPSSLGSGPLNRPGSRVVSNNYRSISAPTPASAKIEESSLRSLSYPAGRDKENASQALVKAKPRESLSMSSRRADTSLCISSLDDTLARLKARNKPDFKAAPKRVLSATVVQDDKSDKAKLLGLTPRSVSLAPMPQSERHSAPSRFQVLVDNSRQTAVLKGVVAFVDVHSAEGTDGSAPFINMLKLSGARVLKRPSESCTHIIYKDGKPSTAAFWRRLPESKRPEVVGIRWVTMCRERGKWVEEAGFRVDLNEQDIFQVVRRQSDDKLKCRNASPWSRSGSRLGRSLPNCPPPTRCPHPRRCQRSNHMLVS